MVFLMSFGISAYLWNPSKEESMISRKERTKGGGNLRLIKSFRLEHRIPSKVSGATCRYNVTLYILTKSRATISHSNPSIHAYIIVLFFLLYLGNAFKDHGFMARPFAIGNGTQSITTLIIKANQHLIQPI